MNDYYEVSRRPSWLEVQEMNAWDQYERTREERERAYERWCKENMLDPQDVQSMVEYEMTFDDSFRV